MTSLKIEATSPSIGTALTSLSPLASEPSSLSQLSDQAFEQSNGARLSKVEVRRSLRASTFDGTFSSVFENIVKGVLISNLLLGLGAGAFEVGLLTSIPMVAHLLQPLGAYFSEKTTSRHAYCLWIFGTARLLWLIPAVGIFMYSHGSLTAQALTFLTMGVLTVSNILESVGCASWMSWMAMLVPVKLRGRYFSLRRSLSSLTALLTIPVGGWLVSRWMGGEVEGYGVVLIVAVLMGLASLCFQFYMSDVNPQAVKKSVAKKSVAQKSVAETISVEPSKQAASDQEKVCEEKVLEAKVGPVTDLSKSRNFLMLLLFLGVWTFSVNLSAPFFNYYLLDTLHLDVQWVTLYSSLRYGAFFLAIMLWGRLADRIGNRPVLIINCVLAAIIPFMWSFADGSLYSVWLALPLLHMAQGGTFAALDLCLANIQLELAPLARQSVCFAIAAAVMGVTGALGTTAGGYLAELSTVGLPALFALTAIVRLVSIAPLLFVQEDRALSIRQLLDQQRQRVPQIWQLARIKA